MKIGILTYYGVHNHGAALQANGLKAVLQKMGHEVQFLTFNRSYNYISPSNAKKYTGGFRSIPFFTKYLFQKGLSNILFNLKKNRILKKYRNQYIPLGVSYKEFDGDIVIVGSDEVFSLEIGYNPFFYGLGISSKKIVSYAGSFGPTMLSDIEDKGLNMKISEGFKKMQAISVRDKNSQTIIDELIGVKTPIVCDPVILYGYEKEINSFSLNNKSYIIIYAYDRNMQNADEVEAIKALAKRYNKKIYSLAYYHAWCDRNIQIAPDKLFEWIGNADCVITDTFHGAVISLICNTPMIVKLRDNSNKLKFLLNEYDLSDRIISDFGELERIYNSTVNFNKVNKRIVEKRKYSFNFLNSVLGE